MGVQNLSKSVKICQSYGHKFAATFLCPAVYMCWLLCEVDVSQRSHLRATKLSSHAISCITQYVTSDIRRFVVIN